MSLLTIADLGRLPADKVSSYMHWAEDISLLYENFIRKDDEDVSFVAGWGGAKHRSVGIHASEMSGECRRPVWYSLQGEVRKDSDIDPFWKKRFRIGHMYHAMIQNDLRRMCEQSGGCMSFESEVKIHPDLQLVAAQYGIYSSCDGVIVFRDQPWGAAKLRIGLEIKTASPDEHKDLKEPKDTHRRQACVYMKCLDIPLLYTLYINKGNQNIIPSSPPFLFRFDHKLWNTIEQETKEVIHLSVINQIPDRVEQLGCQFCGYAWTCKPESLARKAYRQQAIQEREQRAKRTRRHGPSGIRTPRKAQQ